MSLSMNAFCSNESRLFEMVRYNNMPSTRRKRRLFPYPGSKAGKYVEIINRNLPDTYRHVFDPFIGSASVLMASGVASHDLHIGDADCTITETLVCIQKHYSSLRTYLERLQQEFKTSPDPRAWFIANRRALNDILVVSGVSVERAARRIAYQSSVLSGFVEFRNGRFNGSFSPYAHFVYHSEALDEMKDLLHRAHVQTGDFEALLSTACKQDFIFLDPPYVFKGTSKYALGRKGYYSTRWSAQDTDRLVREVRRLHNLGAYIMLWNVLDESLCAELPFMQIAERIESIRMTEVCMINYCGNRCVTASDPDQNM